MDATTSDPLATAGLTYVLHIYVVHGSSLLVALLAGYPASRWFAELKRRRRDWWLSYL